MKSVLRIFSLPLLLLGLASPAHAATLNISGGQLISASGITVSGFSGTYAVAFVEGTCQQIFSGCDDPITDFAFTTQAGAAAAAQALLDQVFLNTPIAPADFDTDPELTLGCSSLSVCTAYIPFELGAANTGLVNTMGARNGAGGGTGFNDSVFGGASGFGFDFDDWDSSDQGPSVYAVFAAEIPLPAAFWFFASAMAGLAGVRAKKS